MSETKDFPVCKHEWDQFNLGSVKYADILYLGKGRHCQKCNMVMLFGVVEATTLLQ